MPTFLVVYKRKSQYFNIFQFLMTGVADMAFRLLSVSDVSSHSLLLNIQLNRAQLFGYQQFKQPAWHFVCMLIQRVNVILWIGASVSDYPILSHPIPLLPW